MHQHKLWIHPSKWLQFEQPYKDTVKGSKGGPDQAPRGSSPLDNRACFLICKSGHHCRKSHWRRCPLLLHSQDRQNCNPQPAPSSTEPTEGLTAQVHHVLVLPHPRNTSTAFFSRCCLHKTAMLGCYRTSDQAWNDSAVSSKKETRRLDTTLCLPIIHPHFPPACLLCLPSSMASAGICKSSLCSVWELAKSNHSRL